MECVWWMSPFVCFPLSAQRNAGWTIKVKSVVWPGLLSPRKCFDWLMIEFCWSVWNGIWMHCTMFPTKPKEPEVYSYVFIFYNPKFVLLWDNCHCALTVNQLSLLFT
jgi:hypothetical protein